MDLFDGLRLRLSVGDDAKVNGAEPLLYAQDDNDDHTAGQEAPVASRDAAGTTTAIKKLKQQAPPANTESQASTSASQSTAATWIPTTSLDVTQQNEEPHVHAGRKAEESFLTDLLSINGVNRCALFPGLRVPYWSRNQESDDEQDDNVNESKEKGTNVKVSRKKAAKKCKKNGDDVQDYEFVTLPKVTAARLARGEVDMVIVSQRGIFVIEIKNWSGTLSTDGMMSTHWYQHRTNGTTLLHKNAITSIEEKSRNLLLHLRREGCEVPSNAIVPRVVFVNPRLSIDPVIAESGRVIQASQLPAFVASFRRSALETATENLLPLWLTGCEISAPMVLRAQHVLKYTVGTWDIVTLQNGKRLIGDFRDVIPVTQEHTQTSRERSSHPIHAFHTSGGRVRISTLTFFHHSDPIDWLKKNVLGWPCSRICITSMLRSQVALDPEKPFHHRVVQSLKSVLDDTIANILPASTVAVVDATDCMVFHVCGEKEPSRIPVSEVSSLRLSRI